MNLTFKNRAISEKRFRQVIEDQAGDGPVRLRSLPPAHPLPLAPPLTPGGQHCPSILPSSHNPNIFFVTTTSLSLILPRPAMGSDSVPTWARGRWRWSTSRPSSPPSAPSSPSSGSFFFCWPCFSCIRSDRSLCGGKAVVRKVEDFKLPFSG